MEILSYLPSVQSAPSKTTSSPTSCRDHCVAFRSSNRVTTHSRQITKALLERTSIGGYDGLRVRGVDLGTRSKALSFEDATHAVAVPGDLHPFLGRRSKNVAKKGLVEAVFERFTERAIKCVFLAQREAKNTSLSEVGTEHLLLGLIAEEERSREGFLGSGVTLDRAREAVKQEHIASGLTATGSSPKHPAEIPFSQESKYILEAVHGESRRMGHNFIAPEHLAICLLSSSDTRISKLMERLGLRKEKLVAEAVGKLRGEMETEGRSTATIRLRHTEKQKALTGSTTRRSGSRKDSVEGGVLADFCIDITARAAKGEIDPVIGRERETQRVVEILGRRTKNNALLLGEPGVGKTAIAEGLALLIKSSSPPEYLADKRVLSLDVGMLLAGAKERGEMETRVTKMVEEIKSSGNVILFIDELHTIVGSGAVGRNSGGSGGAGLDISNMLKPALARGELQCIGATTIAEHRKHIEKDKALSRRFQPVMVHEPSEEDAVHILMGLRPMYERHHRCRISDAAVVAAVQLSSRYISDRFLPDKAIDLMDEAGSRIRIQGFEQRRSWQTRVLAQTAEEYWAEIRKVEKAFDKASKKPSSSSQKGGGIAGLWVPFKLGTDGSDEPELAYVPELIAAEKNMQDEVLEVGVEEIASVASLWSGVPLNRLTADQESLLLSMEDGLAKKFVGQENAVRAIARAVRRARVGLKNPDRPIAAMMFCGPTGVGKTQLTKCLADYYFGSEEAMVRLDMSEYMERHTISKLIGSPPGYIGYGEGGRLTEAVRRRPFTIVLLDEIEKAHPDVFNLLLQIFEDGRLTDSQGRTVSFKNAVIVMTSNVGSQVIARGGGQRMGFSVESEEGEKGESRAYTALKELVNDELKGFFRPEFLNRLDEVVVFEPLKSSEVRAIVNLLVAESKGRMLARGLRLEITEAMMAHICREGFDPTYGARALRRAIVRLVDDPVSEAVLGAVYGPDDTALLDVDVDGLPMVVRIAAAREGEADKYLLPILKTVTVAMSD